MNKKDQSSFVLVLACLGVVLIHITGDYKFYIGHAGDLNLKDLANYFREHGILQTLSICLKGATAVIGVFFINSGYGLSCSYKNQDIMSFYKKRLIKVWFYSFICCILCTIFVLALKRYVMHSYVYFLIPIYGFYEMPRDYYVMQYWFLSLIFIYYLLFPVLHQRMNTSFLLITSFISISVGYLIVFNVYQNVSLYHSTLHRLIEFSFGIYMAKNTKVESFFFNFNYKKILFSILLALFGYALFFIPVLSPFSNLIFSIGIYLLGLQCSRIISGSETVISLFARLKSGTFTLYLLHLVSINYCVKIAIIVFSIQNNYLMQVFFTILFSLFGLMIFGYMEDWYNKKTKLKLQHMITRTDNKTA